jgi:transketolase
MFERGFHVPELTAEHVAELEERARRCRGAILTMTSAAASGHPGGSMSSLEMYLTLYHGANLRPDEPSWPERDRIVVSHGHTSPGVYSALADAGFFDIDQATAHFRQDGSPFEGHVERVVPGVEWDTGNLGQGLSAAVGFALASKVRGGGWHTYCAMSDGEQHKGQVAEARRFAVHHGLTDLTVLVDLNGIQISGHTWEIMPVDIVADWHADGWRVLEVDGHDFGKIYDAVRTALADDSAPTCIVCHTVIGKGVSFMEDTPEYHGAALGDDLYEKAMAELGLDPYLEETRARRAGTVDVAEVDLTRPALPVAPGTPRTYTRDKDADNRGAWGNALADLAEANPDLPISVLDCDLVPSVKTGAFAEVRPEGFFQAGVGEHNAATVSGVASIAGVLSFWSDFGVFGVDEVYNQQRLNDINMTSLKLAVTHCGLDVGEDGKTHQCLDYVGAFRNFYGWKSVVPADPNQTDRAVRVCAGLPGDFAIAMGRSKLPVVLGDDGEPLFAGDYTFEYGRIDWAREGDEAVVLAMGTCVGAAVDAADELAAEGRSVGVAVVACPLDLDDEAMRVAVEAPLVVTVEDHNVRTGLGASVADWMATHGDCTRLVRLGVEGYQASGAAKDLLAAAGLDASGVATALRMALG